ncbi:hypothetical protein FACS1894111_08580 [Clostridia bacterium]|nr:hypothetical protein FACS1894111_08580 [Clostridia bacterium]
MDRVHDFQIFLQKFKVPEVAQPVIDDFVALEEQQMIAALPEQFTPKDIQAITDEMLKVTGGLAMAVDYAQLLYQRGIFSLIKEGNPAVYTASDEVRLEELPKYRLSGFYEFLDVFAVSCHDTYKRFPKTIRKALDQWYFEAYSNTLSRKEETITADESLTEDEIITADEALFRIDHEKRQLYLAPCDCRSLGGDCGQDLLTCLSYRDEINSFAHRGISKPISKEEGKRIIAEAEQAGLVHTANENGMCNCCSDCCYLFRARTRLGTGSFWPKTTSVVSVNTAICIGCGACAKRCNFLALHVELGQLLTAPEHCVGCGLCVTVCPVEALSVQERV